MTAAALLAEAHGAGIRLSVRGDRLRIEAKAGAVSADMRARLASGKSELIKALTAAESDMRAHLLHLADCEGVDAAHVHRLPAADLAACEGLGDEVLGAYLRALVRSARMDAGLIPDGYSQSVRCDGCGPVWLWPEAPERVKACPWCWNRKAGKRIPRPLVTCGPCAHYLPDPLNPDAGMGGCALGAARAYWPMRQHRCPDWR
jgi:hypothetical protein